MSFIRARDSIADKGAEALFPLQIPRKSGTEDQVSWKLAKPARGSETSKNVASVS